ncbi:hypothetical protein [Streptomyces mirabilis]|uniref:hypothetical protein n=1 Tax=Streptomyces mirabilis TaxID=68239 RepID=UPI0036A2551C
MKITVIGWGRVGVGLACTWTAAGHDVTALGRDGGDATDADAVVVAVPAAAITEALASVSGLAGQVTLDACKVYRDRDESFPSSPTRSSRSPNREHERSPSNSPRMPATNLPSSVI